jgi:hypothetical protein
LPCKVKCWCHAVDRGVSRQSQSTWASKPATPPDNIDGDVLAWQAALPVPKLTPENVSNQQGTDMDMHMRRLPS